MAQHSAWPRLRQPRRNVFKWRKSVLVVYEELERPLFHASLTDYQMMPLRSSPPSLFEQSYVNACAFVC
jgi:hypothetical protein